MYHGWVKSTPTFIYALFIGALSDRFGRKPLILLPIFGALIDHVLGFINIENIENFPVEFFYVMSFEYFLGKYTEYRYIRNASEILSNFKRKGGKFGGFLKTIMETKSLM
jgi:hypothetical protein